MSQIASGEKFRLSPTPRKELGAPPKTAAALPPGSAIRLVAGSPQWPSAGVGRQSHYGGTTPVRPGAKTNTLSILPFALTGHRILSHHPRAIVEKKPSWGFTLSLCYFITSKNFSGIRNEILLHIHLARGLDHALNHNAVGMHDAIQG